MTASNQFSVRVFQVICDRYRSRAGDLAALIGADVDFREWLVAEAFLACERLRATGDFCEATWRPSYSSEGVADGAELGDLRVGGPHEGADHCWLFAEFALLRESRSLDVQAAKLKRLGWKKSAALAIVIAVDSAAAGWDGPPLVAPVAIQLPGGPSLTITAFDMKQDPNDILAG